MKTVKDLIDRLEAERNCLKTGVLTIDKIIGLVMELFPDGMNKPVSSFTSCSGPTQVIKANLDPVGANKPVTETGAKKKRGTFAETGEQMILGRLSTFKTQTTGQLNTAWVGDGRKGKADNAICRLVKAKKIKRVKDGSIRGSRYVLA